MNPINESLGRLGEELRRRRAAGASAMGASEHLSDNTLQALADGSLGSLETPAARSHIAQCLECLNAYGELRALWDMSAPPAGSTWWRAAQRLRKALGARVPAWIVPVAVTVPAAAAAKISESFGIPAAEFPRTVNRLLEVGPQHVHPEGVEKGVAIWRAVWDAIRLEERFVAIQTILDAPLPAGVKSGLLENLVGDGVMNSRFQISSGAVESFLNTIPLLHPRGYLQVQDIFVTRLDDYSRMFRGPGKMDGSIVNWVNGALLAQVGAQAGPWISVDFSSFANYPDRAGRLEGRDAASRQSPSCRHAVPGRYVGKSPIAG